MHTAIRIVDDEGRDVVPGNVGELLTKGPHITPGYWNKPEATAKASPMAGCTPATPRARTMKASSISSTWKDMYISGGENVYPAEVENVLFQIPEVADAASSACPTNAGARSAWPSSCARRTGNGGRRRDPALPGQAGQVQGPAIGGVRRFVARNATAKC